MKLRNLQQRDAPRMLEWMHDDFVVHDMGAKFMSKTLQDCEKFIAESNKSTNNLHMAIVNEDNCYMGTVSLKHIDTVNKCAEFAITVVKGAMGKGYSKFGMSEIIKIGFKELGLNRIYWCVSDENKRAIRFYNKNEYKEISEYPEIFRGEYTDKQIRSYRWYMVEKQRE